MNLLKKNNNNKQVKNEYFSIEKYLLDYPLKIEDLNLPVLDKLFINRPLS